MSDYLGLVKKKEFNFQKYFWVPTLYLANLYFTLPLPPLQVPSMALCSFMCFYVLKITDHILIHVSSMGRLGRTCTWVPLDKQLMWSSTNWYY